MKYKVNIPKRNQFKILKISSKNLKNMQNKGNFKSKTDSYNLMTKPRKLLVRKKNSC